MSNSIYNKYKTALMIAASDISLTNENVKVSLVDSDVTAFSSAHEFYSDLVDIL